MDRSQQGFLRTSPAKLMGSMDLERGQIGGLGPHAFLVHPMWSGTSRLTYPPRTNGSQIWIGSNQSSSRSVLIAIGLPSVPLSIQSPVSRRKGHTAVGRPARPRPEAARPLPCGGGAHQSPGIRDRDGWRASEVRC